MGVATGCGFKEIYIIIYNAQTVRSRHLYIMLKIWLIMFFCNSPFFI